MRRADFIARDLVIVFGGDGTLTSLSHNIDAATPVMGVNSHPRTDDPDGSYGFYMDSSISTFEEDVKAVFEGRAIVNELVMAPKVCMARSRWVASMVCSE